MTFNQVLAQVGEEHPGLMESVAHLLENLPELPLVPSYEKHRWYINLEINGELRKVGNL